METFYNIFDQVKSAFLIFVQGVLTFQTVYMIAQYVLSRRVEFLWYILYLVSAIIICFSVRSEEGFYEIFLESTSYGISLSVFSFICYWMFWKHLFEINRADGAIYFAINGIVILLAFFIGFDILSHIIPLLKPLKDIFYGVFSFAPQVLSIWLFVFTFRNRDKVLAGILISGALMGNIVTLISQVTFLDLLNGNNPQSNSLLWFFLGYLLETTFFSIALAYRTRQIFYKNKRLEVRIAETKMAALRAQMNPHFIHNCLNAINRFILNNENEAAIHYLTRFSRLIRDVLNHSREVSIPLSDELTSIRRYLEMESLRFNDQFKYDIQIGANVAPEKVKIPPMLIQPFVENAIYHGLLPKKGERNLDIDIQLELTQLKVSITDNGIGRSAAARLRNMNVLQTKAFGAQITQERVDALRDFTGAHTSVETRDLHDIKGAVTGTQVILTVPV